MIDATEGCVDVSVHLPTSFSVSLVFVDFIDSSRPFDLIKPITNSTVSIHAKNLGTKATKFPAQLLKVCVVFALIK